MGKDIIYMQNPAPRSKRVISKPIRYQTTSSDESLMKRRSTAAAATIVPRTIDDDFEDINRILERKSPMPTDINRLIDMIQPYTQHTPQYTHTNTQPHTNILSYTGCVSQIQTYGNTPGNHIR
ncbi:uncharacterized protein LOC112468089 [Temnothorax curvispinosus]|uniref:Uncharacterized protein LOC112468089 n=1 Tax=Temnothorax curvispinosus TaxID=300111 RepID=A0A6J1RF32_9HYME|nr:uncharacterized protein LOC112468089 [Temnothorax curvispinosus]